MIYIQYYIIKLSYIVNQDELSKIEWLLIKKILLIFITCKIEIKITDLCQIILIDYFKDTVIDFLDYNLYKDIFNFDYSKRLSEYISIKKFLK